MPEQFKKETGERYVWSCPTCPRTFKDASKKHLMFNVAQHQAAHAGVFRKAIQEKLEKLQT